MTRNLQVAWPLASLNFHDAALDDVVNVSIADGAVLTFPMVDSAEDGLKSRDLAKRETATAEAIELGVDPRLILSAQLLNNSGYRRHSERLPDLEKRARLLSGEYREVQKSRPIDVVPVSGD